MFRQATENMKNAIHSLPEEKKKFILEYEPCADRGYAWDENETYKEIKEILSIKTDSDGHSGASFSVCLRCAIEQLQMPVIQAEEVTKDVNTNCLTLDPV